MDATELLKKVRKIEIKTRGLSQNIFAGEYHSAFKGRGMTFSEVREYQYGDDIRDIDWNVTARQNHPYVKVYEEEREMTVMLLIDTSGSRCFGAVGMEKREMITEIAATLAFSAIHNNDKIGVIFFSDKIEKFIPIGLPTAIANVPCGMESEFPSFAIVISSSVSCDNSERATLKIAIPVFPSYCFIDARTVVSSINVT